MSAASGRAQVREFLVSRRARITPAEAGIRDLGTRRVPGLRREEVAALAAISVEYYTQLERGNLRGVSDVVLETLMGALRLDDVERAYVLDLVRQANRSGHGPHSVPRREIRAELQQMLDAMPGVAVTVRNDRMDLLGGNARGKALYAAAFALPEPNLARHVFLDPLTRDFSIDHDRMADIAAGTLRIAVARDPDDAELLALIDELRAASADFRERWQRHPVRRFGSGTQSFRHPVVGELHLQHEQLRLVSEPDVTLNIYSAAPGTASAAALEGLLAPLEGG